MDTKKLVLKSVVAKKKKRDDEDQHQANSHNTRFIIFHSFQQHICLQDNQLTWQRFFKKTKKKPYSTLLFHLEYILGIFVVYWNETRRSNNNKKKKQTKTKLSLVILSTG